LSGARCLTPDLMPCLCCAAPATLHGGRISRETGCSASTATRCAGLADLAPRRPVRANPRRRVEGWRRLHATRTAADAGANPVASRTSALRLSTLRGDYIRPDGTTGNRLRQWEKLDFSPRHDDLLQERLYCVEWMRPKRTGKGEEYEFRSVTEADLCRDRIVQEYVRKNIAEWQGRGWIPDMRIEVGGPPRYQGLDLVRARGWTHWHHLFNSRQLVVACLVNQSRGAAAKFALTRMLNKNSRLSRWDANVGGGGATQGVFDNQALNTIYNFGTRGIAGLDDSFITNYKHFPLMSSTALECVPSDVINQQSDVFVTDPPYGDAVMYHEITDFFIAWLRKNPPPEFANWVWDSRRSLAIKGEDEDFRRGLVLHQA
jgi:putative DNA methylase